MASSSRLSKDDLTNKEILTKDQRGSLYARAWKEPDFYRLLQADPAKAIKEHLGVTVPNSVVAELHRRVKAGVARGLTSEHTIPPSCC